MDRQDFAAWEARVRDRANVLWQAAGRPESGSEAFLDKARELIALAEVPIPTLDPEAAAAPVVEEAEIQGNLGEFPTLTDQGEEQVFPARDPDGGPQLSDGDASDDGGVLPEEDVPSLGLPDAALADGDVTTSAVTASDEPLPPDHNDDGVPDLADLDRAEGAGAGGEEDGDTDPPDMDAITGR